MRSALLLAVSLLSVSISMASTPVFAQAAAPKEVVPGPSDSTRKSWGFDKSNIRPDPNILYGVLPNGMKYAILRNETPKHSAAVRMRFDIGSTADLSAQEGGAHFLEHMAFNGSKRVPEGEMIKLLERDGLAFGADTNASTSFTETTYKLDLPQVTPNLIDTALMLMRETASELILAPSAVERERGVILGEMRARENFGLRQARDQIAFLVPGTPIARALPIGNEAGIKGVNSAGLRQLYESFYTPERATFVFVGDVDPVLVEKQIIAKFGDWQGKMRVDRDPVTATIDQSRPFSTRFFLDPDVPTVVAIAAVKPLTGAPDSEDLRASDFKEALASMVLNRRISGLARKPDARFTNGSASIGDFISTARQAGILVVAKDRDWTAATQIAEQELRRALVHGFTNAEIKEQASNLRTVIKTAVDQASTRQSAALAGGILGSLEQDRIFNSPSDGLALFEKLAPSFTARQISDAFIAAWSGTKPLVHVSHNEALADADKAVAAAWENSAKVAVTAPAANDNQAFAHTEFGPAGKVVADTRIADLNVRTVRFANNVQLNIKQTDFEKGRVRLSVRIGGGMLEFPQRPDGLGPFMSTVFAAGGTTKHSADELQSVLAGRIVSGGINAELGNFSVIRATTPADLELQLQLSAAYVTAPGFRPEAEAQWKAIVGTFIPTLDSQPSGVAARDVPRILASGDARFGLGSEANLKAVTFDQLRKVITPALTSGHIEIAIVGDIDETTAITLVGKTFGALASRQDKLPSYAGGRNVRFPESRAPITLTHSGKPDQAMAMIVWPTTDDTIHREEVRLQLLSKLIQLQVTEVLREKMGATYSPSADSSLSWLFKGYGQMVVTSTSEPGKIDEIFAAVDAIGSELAARRPSADLITRARTPMLERIGQQRRENPYWLLVIDEAQTFPRDLRYVRDGETILKSITAAELQATAKKYLLPSAALRIRIVPKSPK